MGEVYLVEFRKPQKKRRRPVGLALTYAATSDGRVLITARGERYFSVTELTELINDLKSLRADAKAARRKRA